MQLWADYGAVLIVVGQLLAVLGVLIILYFIIRQRLQERVETGKKPDRTGLPYPDLYYWQVLRQRSSVMGRIRRVFRREKSQGI